MDRCHALAQPHLEQGLLDVIFAEGGEDALVNRTDYTQPALFAVEYALAELLKSWGIAPDAVIGHSLGEFAAAYAADVMSLEDAMRLVITRGALMHGLAGRRGHGLDHGRRIGRASPHRQGRSRDCRGGNERPAEYGRVRRPPCIENADRGVGPARHNTIGNCEFPTAFTRRALSPFLMISKELQARSSTALPNCP